MSTETSKDVDENSAADQQYGSMSLSPLSSIIETFVGRDTEGPLFTRLEHQTTAEQAEHIPNIITGLVSRLQDTNPDYVKRLELKLPKLPLEADRVPVPKQRHIVGGVGEASMRSRRTKNIAAKDVRPVDEIRQAKLLTLNRFRYVARELILETLTDPVTKAFPASSSKKLEAFARYPDIKSDPLVQLAAEAGEILNAHELHQLGKATFLGSVALIQFLSSRPEAKRTDSGPSSAA